MSSFRRSVLLAALVTVALPGCSVFRSKDVFSEAQATRPLEVPPDLDPAAVANAAVSAPTSVSRSQMGLPAGQAQPAGFFVASPRNEVYAKVGTALAGMTGVTIANRAELLGTYDVAAGASRFLVRTAEVTGGSYVTAIDARGVASTDPVALKVVADLKAALGVP